MEEITLIYVFIDHKIYKVDNNIQNSGDILTPEVRLINKNGEEYTKIKRYIEEFKMPGEVVNIIIMYYLEIKEIKYNIEKNTGNGEPCKRIRIYNKFSIHIYENNKVYIWFSNNIKNIITISIEQCLCLKYFYYTRPNILDYYQELIQTYSSIYSDKSEIKDVDKTLCSYEHMENIYFINKKIREKIKKDSIELNEYDVFTLKLNEDDIIDGQLYRLLLFKKTDDMREMMCLIRYLVEKYKIET